MFVGAGCAEADHVLVNALQAFRMDASIEDDCRHEWLAVQIDGRRCSDVIEGDRCFQAGTSSERLKNRRPARTALVGVIGC